MKISAAVIIIILIEMSALSVTAQNTEGTQNTATTIADDMADKLAAYSRPGKFHQLLADLVGSWTFKGANYYWTDSVTRKVAVETSGTIVRKSFAGDRFFITEMTTDLKLDLPVRDGKMEYGYGRSIQTEGYNNVTDKFQMSYINNHIGSDISFMEGTYDGSSRIITFESESELLPGMKIKSRSLFIFQDHNHYKFEIYEETNGKFLKMTEMNFSRSK